MRHQHVARLALDVDLFPRDEPTGRGSERAEGGKGDRLPPEVAELRVVADMPSQIGPHGERQQRDGEMHECRMHLLQADRHGVSLVAFIARVISLPCPQPCLELQLERLDH